MFPRNPTLGEGRLDPNEPLVLEPPAEVVNALTRWVAQETARRIVDSLFIERCAFDLSDAQCLPGKIFENPDCRFCGGSPELFVPNYGGDA